MAHKTNVSDSIYNFRVIMFLKYESRRSNFLKDLKQSFEANRNGAPPEQAFDSFLSIFESDELICLNQPPWFNGALKVSSDEKWKKAHRNWKKQGNSTLLYDFTNLKKIEQAI